MTAVAPASAVRVTRSDRLWLWFAFVCGALVLLTVACKLRGWTTVETVLYMPVVASGAVGAMGGVIRHRPRARRAWLLLAGGQLAFVAGCVVIAGQGKVFPGVADVLYLAVYPQFIGAVLTFARCRSSRRQPAELLDAGIVTTAAALVAWLHLIGPLARTHGASVPVRVVGMAYPVMDLLLLGVALRMVLARGRRPPAFYLLAAGLTAYLATDVGYCVMSLTGGYGGPDSWVTLAYMIPSVLIGTAALHPSMNRMDQPPVTNDIAATGRRIAFLCAASLVAPAELVVAAWHGGTGRGDTVVIAGACAVLVLLVLTRMAALE